MTCHRRRRAVSVAILFGLVGAWAPVRVDAHAKFQDTSGSVAPDTDIALTLHVENEGTAGTYNAKVTIRLPAGWTGVECETKPTWTCTIAIESQRDVIRFTKDEGAAPAEDETFSITLHSGTNLGTATFPVLQTYNTGEEVGWIGDPGLENEAPTLEVTADGTPPTTMPAETTTIPPATTVTPTAAPTTTAIPATVAPTSAPSNSAATTATVPTDTAVVVLAPTTTQPVEADSDDGNAAEVILIVLVLAAAGAAMFYYWRQRKAPAPPE